MITGYNESTLSKSEIFTELNDTIQLQQKAVEEIKSAQKLTKEDIEAAFIQVKQISDSLTKAAIKEFETEKIILLYEPNKDKRVTQALPFITLRSKNTNKVATYIFADKYVTINRDDVMTMQPANLRDLLLGAVISNGLKRNYNALANNSYLEEICMQMYTKFFTRVLNRQYSIMTNKILFDQLQYMINRFFLENVYNANDSKDNIDKLAKSHIRYLEEMGIQEMTSAYEQKSPEALSELLDLMKDFSPRLKTLGKGTFITEWVSYLYRPSMFAIDNMEYFLFICLTLLNGNGIINTGAGDIVKEQKGIKNFRGELLKLVK